jgi:CHASE3 domain sensor protein
MLCVVGHYVAAVAACRGFFRLFLVVVVVVMVVVVVVYKGLQRLVAPTLKKIERSTTFLLTRTQNNGKWGRLQQ